MALVLSAERIRESAVAKLLDLLKHSLPALLEAWKAERLTALQQAEESCIIDAIREYHSRRSAQMPTEVEKQIVSGRQLLLFEKQAPLSHTLL